MSKILKRYSFLIILFIFSGEIFSQGQGNWWFFGQTAGLNFNTSPPTATTGALTTQEGCSSISDPAGNLLMYTDGLTVYTKTHTTMSNGTGLNGNSSTAQSAVIVKQPGNTDIYYIFTMGVSNTGSLYYSVVDMSLAAGMGSVTVKNTYLYGQCLEKLTAVKHSNNQDVWVLVHENGTSINFRAYLLTSTGVSTTAVVSSVGTSGNTQSIGYLRASPNGQHIASAFYGGNGCELYDFNRSTGVLSNPIQLTSGGANYGCEFSPDGTKLYVSNPGRITQWSICAGSATAIAASQYSMSASSNWAMQLGPDGKIYVSRYQTSTLGIISNPNVAGSGCNYSDNGMSISPASCRLGLPNYVTSWFMPPSPQFTTIIGTPTNGIGCMTASFTSPPTLSLSLPGCSALTTSLTGLSWHFGDPGSGSANTSTQLHPTHFFSNLGTYTISLILNYSNNGGTDTVQQVININQPCISVSSTSITCANLGSATVTALGGVGPFQYTWMPSSQTGSAATGLSPGAYTISVHDLGNSYTYTAQTIFISLIPLTGNLVNTASLACFGASNGTAAIINITGGSGNQTYQWTNASSTFTQASPNTLSAGIWSVTATDALTGCKINQSFFISQPPAMNLPLASSTPSACAGGSIVLTGTNSGGTPFSNSPAYTYSWTAGPSVNSNTVSEVVAGTYVYTLVSSDSNNCSISNTISVNFIINPNVTVVSDSICPFKTGTLTANGASTYVWDNLTTASTLTASPLISTVYTVTGSAAGCTATATGSINVLPVPVPVIFSNSPLCNGQVLQIQGFGGSAYQWSGPSSLTANTQTVSVNPVTTSHGGVYNLTVTAPNSCTASTSSTIVVHPTPTLAATGATVCSTGIMNLSANSLPGATFAWAGPNTFNSSQQNPTLLNPGTSASGNYSVTATSAAGCTNMATAHVTVTQAPVTTLISDGPKCAGSSISFSATGGDSFVWNGPGSFSSNLQFPSIPNAGNAAAGIYTVMATLGPCITQATHTLVIHPLPTPVASNSGPVCETFSIQLSTTTSSNYVAYVWYGPSFTSYTSQVVRHSSKLSYSGTYTVVVTDIHQCQGSALTSVTIKSNPTITASGATVCLHQPAVITATGASTYQWTGPAFFQSSQRNATISAVSPGKEGMYQVVGTASNSCTDTTAVTVGTVALPVPSLTVSPNTRVCLNEAVTLRGSGGFFYKWLGPEGFFFDEAGVTFTASMLHAGFYTLVVTDVNSCTSSISTPLMVDDLPGGKLIGPTDGCVPFCGDYRFSDLGNPSNTVTSTWNLNGKSFKDKFNYCFQVAGDYHIYGLLTDQKTGCKNTVELLVNIHEKPDADFKFQPELPVELLDEVYFENTSSGSEQSSWTWFFHDDSLTVKRAERISYIFPEPGNYPVALLIENLWGCKDTLVKEIKVIPDFHLYVPNIFTPNGDGDNEIFLPVGRGVKSYNIKIFNRWGHLVFESSELENGWDGTFQGQAAKSDVYSWKAVVSSPHGESRAMNGHVSLVR